MAAVLVPSCAAGSWRDSIVSLTAPDKQAAATAAAAAAAAAAVPHFIGINAYYLTAYAAFGTLPSGESGTGAVDKVLDSAQVHSRT
jgi:hypothetical protein